MLMLDWNNPKISIVDFDTFLRNYLSTVYDGIVIQDNKVTVNTISELTSDQVTYITSWFYSLNNIPQQVIVSANNPFDAKTIVINGVTHQLFIRYTGVQQDLTVGNNIIIFTIPYPWVKMIGLECINCETLDTASLFILDSTTGLYTGVPNQVLNQFGYNVNLPKDFYSRVSSYDADLRQNMQIKIVYTSTSAKRFGANFILHEVV